MGQIVELFQKAVDGRAQGESWCLSFVMACAMQVDRQFDYALANILKITPIPMVLYQTEHVLTCWNKSPYIARIPKPEIGCLILWQYFKNRIGTASGHVGIVQEEYGDDVLCIEGNTNANDPAVIREGNVVASKRRRWKTTAKDSMQFRGFLRVWLP